MKILIIGKFPPIAGGESAKTYWLARGLGEAGHKVKVVSNCQEVEDDYRISLSGSDLDYLQPKNVTLHSTSPFEYPNFIPYFKPYTDKLISLALEVCDIFKPDIVLGWYMLPYWTAAHFVAKATRAKLVLQHAGSDMNRILLNPGFYKIYEHILSEADLILAYGDNDALFRQVTKTQIFRHNVAYAEEYSPAAQPAQLGGFGIPNKKAFLFLGKTGKGKGFEYLLDAFKSIKSDSQLLVFGQELDLTDCENVHSFPHTAPWNIPSIIRSVSTVIVPEHNFGVQQHKSRIPIESLLCGKRPIVSEQFLDKYTKDVCEHLITVDATAPELFARLIDSIANDELDVELSGKTVKALHGIFSNYTEYIDTLASEFANLI